MFKVEFKSAARLAATAGLGLSLAFAAAPVVAMADSESAATTVDDKLQDQDGGVVSGAEGDYSNEPSTGDTGDATPSENVIAVVTDSTGATQDTYSSLSEAIKKVSEGGTVKLARNASGDGVQVAEGKKFTLDLGGFTYMIDGKTVGSTGTETNGFQLLQNSTITIKNGTITSEKALILIQNYSNLTLEDVDLIGGANTRYALSNNNGNTVICKGTNITAGKASPGVAFDVCRFSTYESVSVTVAADAGKITGAIEVAVSNSTSDGAFSLELKGGDLSDAQLSMGSGSDAATIKKETDVTIGAPNDYRWVDNGEGPKLEKIPEGEEDEFKAVAQIGDVQYESLDTAIEVAQNGQTVQLVKDVTDSITIPANKSIALDLAGHKLTNSDKSHTITVDKGGFLTVTDSSADGKGAIDCVDHGKGALVNHGTVVVKGGTFTRSQEASTSPSESGNNSWYVIDNQGTMTFDGGKVVNDSKFSSLVRNMNGTLTINNGEFKNDFIALKNDDGGILVVTGGTVTSDEQAIQNWNNATISGGVLTGKVVAWDYDEGGNSVTTISGGTINGDVMAVNYMDAEKGPEVAIAGGTINGEVSKGTHDGKSGIKPADPGADSSTIVVSGGTFKKAVDDELLADGFELVKNPNGSYGVKKPAAPSQGEHAVKVEQAEGGKVSVTPARADEGDEVTIAATPDKGQEVRSVTVTTKDGKSVKVAKGEKANTWTFDMPDAEVTVKVTFGCDGGELCPTHKFDDVLTGAWYHDVVDWAVEEGLLSGYEDGKLGPDGTLSRAQLATVLWRQAGEPEAEGGLSFADCDPEAFYAEAVAWADEAGIIAGYGDGTNFGPEDPVTREQLATILWRQAGEPEGKGDLSDYPDGGDATDYAVPALEWAVDTGVLSGFGDGSLAPGGVLSRAMLAAMLQRMAE